MPSRFGPPRRNWSAAVASVGLRPPLFRVHVSDPIGFFPHLSVTNTFTVSTTSRKRWTIGFSSVILLGSKSRSLLANGMKGRNDSYVTLIEASLSRAYAVQTGRARSNSQEAVRTEDFGTIPPHFYRELTRTAEGCKLLKESGHFHEFVAIIQSSWPSEDQETMLKVKGCLWAVGNVGSMELGAPFLEETDAVALIVEIAENSGVATMRGTAFFVLGLISRSIHGMEILMEHGWDTPTDSLGRSLGYCLPMRLGTLFSASFVLHPTPRQI